VSSAVAGLRSAARASVGAALLVLLAVLTGVAVASDGFLMAAALAGVVLFLTAAITYYWMTGEYARFGHMSVEVPIFLLLLTTLAFRARDAETLAKNPLDAQGIFRLACIGLALGLALIALLSPGRKAAVDRITTRPIRFYYLYALVVLIGVTVSVFPLLTAFRWFEVVVPLFVLAGAYRSVGFESIVRIERMLYGYIVLLLGSVWLGVLLFPSLTVDRINSPIPLRIQGIYPGVSSDSTGNLGVLLILWTLARLLRPLSERPLSNSFGMAMIGFGFISLIGAQYRTGYVALAVALALLLVLQKKKVWATLAVAAAIGMATLGGSFIADAQPYLLRGATTEQASRLSGRTTYWALAIPVWRESPIIGGGLQTATRFEVLTQLEGGKEVQNIHSTWIEALVGTGLLGVACLAVSLLIALRRALGQALRGGRLVPALVLAVMTVRTLTGGSIEQGGDTSLLFLTLAMGLRDFIVVPRPPADELPPLALTRQAG
jgi:O-antigen ligase